MYRKIQYDKKKLKKLFLGELNKTLTQVNWTLENKIDITQLRGPVVASIDANGGA